MGQIRWAETFEEGQLVVKEWHKVTVHKFNMGDVEDPEIYAAQPIYDWQQTEAGKFIMKYGKEHKFSIFPDFDTYGYKCAIQCEIESKNYQNII